METVQHLFAPLVRAAAAGLAAYPRWFVIICVVVVALGMGWALVKVVKWTLYLAIAAALLVLALVAAAWLLG